MSYPSWTDDPVKDAERYMEYLEEEAEQLPVCDICGEKITEDHYYDIEGDFYCPDCMEKHRIWRL